MTVTFSIRSDQPLFTSTMCLNIRLAEWFILHLITAIPGTCVHAQYTELVSVLYGESVLPSVNDWNEVRNLTKQINDSTDRYTMQNQLIYCPHLSTCSNNYNRGYTSQYTSCCEQCSCSASCLHQGNCCPSFLISENTHAPNVTDTEKSCEVPELANLEMSVLLSTQTYFMITKCKSKQCERFSMASSSFTIPVTSSVSNKTYISMECALCNNETENNILLWNGELECGKSPGLLTFEIIKKDILLNGTCNLFFTPPAGAVTEKCPWGLITKCNMTGKWQSYDARIEYGCNSFTSLYMKTYRNVFCYMCNEALVPYMECSVNFVEEKKYPTSFSILLDFRSMDNDDQHEKMKRDEKCSIDEKYDPFMDICHQMTCSSNLIYEPSNFTCKQPFSAIKAMKYQVYFKLVPLLNPQENDSQSPIQMCSQLKNYILYKFSKKGHLYDGRCSVRMFYKTYSGAKNTSTNCSSEDVSYFTVLLEQAITQTHDFMAKVSDILSFGNSTDNVDTPEGSVLVYMFIMGVDNIPRPKNGNIWFDPEDNGQLYEFYLEEHQDVDFRQCCQLSPMTSVSYTTLCPRIKLKSSNLRLDTSNSVLTVKSLNVTFTAGEYQSDEESYYLVCADKYLRKVNNLTHGRLPPNLNSDTFMVTIEEIFSLLCTVLSVLALLTTIFTYVTFPQLRTIPGKITLGLCITLILAHLLYPFAYMLNTYHRVCVAAGIGIHFFWLSSLFWMNICCVHMFRVFRSVDSLITVSGNARNFIIYIAFAVFGPIVFIVINIGVSLYINDTIGYGGPQCYMTSQEMVLYTFALPIACIILVNIVLFGIVVFKLQNAGNVGMANKTQRNNFKIYAKLSSLTGITWILGFLYQWLLFKPLVFAFIFFVAGQGVFIMMSFVCTSRVKSLYCGRFTQKSMSAS